MVFIILGCLAVFYVGATIIISYEKKAKFTYEMCDILNSKRFDEGFERLFIYLFDNSLNPMMVFKIMWMAMKAEHSGSYTREPREESEFDYVNHQELLEISGRLLLINMIRTPLSYVVVLLLLGPYFAIKKLSGRKNIRESLVFKIGKLC
ncbi:hypothetical protein EDB29_1011127 [Vibrio crassostreae]|uniref:hypothetical protein n=1 Tax=Vibrio crassostreae TaxID=246167 RepID=UPI001050269D|nr:hypothetical protein [Vibrio crassostreae]CAH6850506.1 membrane hypothetical protein [Vibrio chagasii]TCT44315.1 hypothetical protein EDB29_1011127 [Vibrio crassostreae]CAH6861953.1 membrane hypothetical protein [Vibrio chagasii]CAH6925923.1 membrane hypothetical protein [Vibrio chagasii]CAH6944993.1 membrane hypothetical protein [Vibrio chagasii]